MTALTTINLVANLTLRVVHQNFSLATLNENNRVSHQADQNTNHDRGQRMHRARTDQLKQATNRTRQTSCDTGKNNDRDTVAETTFSNLLAKPHQKHRTGDQSHNGGEAKRKTRINHQASLRLQRDSNPQGLERGQHQRTVAGVLSNPATTRLTFLLDRLELW